MSQIDPQTQHYPTLPPPNGGGTPVAVPQAGYGLAPYHPSAYGPVPAMPPRRGAGFWVGITAAVASGVLLALLCGFFIGRSTRLSNSEAQGKITQQQQADQIGQQQALSSQRAVDQKAQDKATAQARKDGESAGLQQGQLQGQQQGYQQGQTAGYNQGQATGQAQGQQQGFQQGQNQGFNQGQAAGQTQGFNSGMCAAQNLVC